MKYLCQVLVLGGALGASLLVGCNTTRNDVTAAREKVAKEERKLDEVKREEARTAQKPVVEPRQDLDRAHDRVVKQEERVNEAKKDEAKTEQQLNTEQSRNTFLIDCKASIDLANRAIEKLQTKKNAADEDGKKAIDQQIADIKSKRDALQSEITNIRTADIKRWTDYHAAAKQAMDDLNEESGKVS